MCFAIDRSRTIISAMILGRRVTAQDVAWLRREVFADGEVTREAADELFAVARARMNNAPEWTEFFVELITDHLVWQTRPTGVVTDEQAHWLLQKADECKTVEALAAMVNVLAEAQRAPNGSSPPFGRARPADGPVSKKRCGPWRDNPRSLRVSAAADRRAIGPDTVSAT